ncbi:hypothetical protein L9F63_012980, partial [Diploptera punctata]
MFGERGYLAFPTKFFARKSPQGFLAWFCTCCYPRRRRESNSQQGMVTSTPKNQYDSATLER